MWETLGFSNGCGLATPQINYPVKLFIIDSKNTYQNMDNLNRQKYFDGDEGIKETFINAEIVEYENDFIVSDDEGCLSIPNLWAPVNRPWKITIQYYDAQFQKQTQTYSGYTARVIQHEYDHTIGILYIDRIEPLRKKILQKKLIRIAKEVNQVKYPMIK